MNLFETDQGIVFIRKIFSLHQQPHSGSDHKMELGSSTSGTVCVLVAILLIVLLAIVNSSKSYIHSNYGTD